MAAPIYTSRRRSSRPGVLELPIIQSLQREIATPRHPSIWLAEIQPHIVGCAINDAVLEDKAGGLAGVDPAVSCDGIVFALLGVGLPGGDEDGAVLEERGRVAKNEVDVALDTARLVVLAQGMGVEIHQHSQRVAGESDERVGERHRAVHQRGVVDVLERRPTVVMVYEDGAHPGPGVFDLSAHQGIAHRFHPTLHVPIELKTRLRRIGSVLIVGGLGQDALHHGLGLL
nr:Os01g0880350 [Ipomoea batatas]GMC66622.1 Os01g0880350 [Ipomoea batatas]GMC67904.1 Os01g0880350 [Ipomoea batatas]